MLSSSAIAVISNTLLRLKMTGELRISPPLSRQELDRTSNACASVNVCHALCKSLLRSVFASRMRSDNSCARFSKRRKAETLVHSVRQSLNLRVKDIGPSLSIFYFSRTS